MNEKTKTITCKIFKISLKIEGNFFYKPTNITEILLKENGRKGVGLYRLSDEIQQVENFIVGSLSQLQNEDLPEKHQIKGSDENSELLPDYEFLKHSTSFVFDTETNILILENKKGNGVSFQAFCGFFEKSHDLQDGTLVGDFLIDAEHLDKLSKIKQIKHFEVQIKKIADGSIYSDDNDSIGQITASSKNTNAQTLDYRIQGSELNITQITKFIKGFRLYSKREVPKIMLKARENNEEKWKTFDLIRQVFDIEVRYPIKRHQKDSLRLKYQNICNKYSEIKHRLSTAQIEEKP